MKKNLPLNAIVIFLCVNSLFLMSCDRSIAVTQDPVQPESLNQVDIVQVDVVQVDIMQEEEAVKHVTSSEMIHVSTLENLPKAISNNAVASVKTSADSGGADDVILYSFLGLESGKDWKAVSRKAFKYVNNSWSQIDDVPVPQGRLASIAVTVKNQIYLFGGYTVAEDHSEVSTPEVLRFNPLNERYQRVANIPIPTDDAVAFVYQDRYIYLVSGWHDKGNINLVQVYDVELDTWQQATQFPGSPVFGHAGGILGNQMLVCDGVKIDYPLHKSDVVTKREFTMSDECYLGRIDNNDITRIHWSKLAQHPGPARYRMAAMGDADRNEFIFIGGSDNPYNFNGIGYDGVPSKPVALVFAYNLKSHTWKELGTVSTPSMDHRGLLKSNNSYIVIGGMDDKQTVVDTVYKINFP